MLAIPGHHTTRTGSTRDSSRQCRHNASLRHSGVGESTMERFDDQALARGPALVWVRYDVADQPLTVILVSAVGRSVKKKRLYRTRHWFSLIGACTCRRCFKPVDLLPSRSQREPHSTQFLRNNRLRVDTPLPLRLC